MAKLEKVISSSSAPTTLTTTDSTADASGNEKRSEVAARSWSVVRVNICELSELPAKTRSLPAAAVAATPSSLHSEADV
jgi:hypothetical protein